MSRTSAARLPVPKAAELFRMLSDQSRLRVLLLLASEREMCVGALGEAIGQTQPATSHHLTLLRMAGLVTFRRDGKTNCYSLASDHVRDLLRLVKS